MDKKQIIVKGKCIRVIKETNHKYEQICNSNSSIHYKCINCNKFLSIKYITNDEPFNWSYKDKYDYVNKHIEFYDDETILKVKNDYKRYRMNKAIKKAIIKSKD